MYFSKDGEKYRDFGIDGRTFTKAKEDAVKVLRIEDGEKFYYKPNFAAYPMIFTHREKT